MSKKTEYIILSVIFLLGLYLWTLPITNIPFGDVDASAHFALGDQMVTSNQPIYRLPQYFKQYFFANDGKIWYPPQFHTDEAIIGSFADRFTAVYLFNAFACLLILVTVYLLIKELFGFYQAALSAFMLIFSIRDGMFYLFGLWPQTISFVFTPLILYLFYKYYTSENKPGYLYLSAAALAVQLLIHMQGAIYSGAVVFIYTLTSFIQDKKLRIEVKPIIIGSIVFLVIAVPSLILSYSSLMQAELTSQPFVVQNVGRLFSWYPNPQDFVGQVPVEFFMYDKMYGWWTLPFLLAGILFLILTFRKKSSLMMISWLFVYYLFMHLDVIGKGARLSRFIGVEGHLFYPLFAIGLFFLLSQALRYIPLAKSQAKPAVAILFIILFASANASETYARFKTAYEPPAGRLTDSEFASAEKIKGIVQNEDIFFVGALITSRGKFMRFLSHNHMNTTKDIVPSYKVPNDYILISYTDAVSMGRRDIAQMIQDYESNLTGYNLLFKSDDDMVRFYTRK